MSSPVSLKPPVPGNDINARWKAVAEYIVHHGQKPIDAVRSAGFSEKSAKGIRWRLWNDQRFMEHLARVTWQKVAENASMAPHLMAQLVGSTRSDYVKLEALKDMLDRGGIRPPDKVQVDSNVTISIDLS